MSSRGKAASRRKATRSRRWLALLLGLAAVGLALYALVGDGDAPLGQIDADSRAQLREVLEAADREAAR